MIWFKFIKTDDNKHKADEIINCFNVETREETFNKNIIYCNFMLLNDAVAVRDLFKEAGIKSIKGF